MILILINISKRKNNGKNKNTGNYDELINKGIKKKISKLLKIYPNFYSSLFAYRQSQSLWLPMVH